MSYAPGPAVRGGPGDQATAQSKRHGAGRAGASLDVVGGHQGSVRGAGAGLQRPHAPGMTLAALRAAASPLWRGMACPFSGPSPAGRPHLHSRLNQHLSRLSCRPHNGRDLRLCLRRRAAVQGCFYALHSRRSRHSAGRQNGRRLFPGRIQAHACGRASQPPAQVSSDAAVLAARVS